MVFLADMVKFIWLKSNEAGTLLQENSNPDLEVCNTATALFSWVVPFIAGTRITSQSFDMGLFVQKARMTPPLEGSL